MQRSQETFDLCIIVKEVMFGLEILVIASFHLWYHFSLYYVL